MNFKIWIKATRIPFISATPVPVILGSAVAWYQTAKFNWGYFWLTLVGGLPLP